jgi:hypothetical protein
MHITSDQISNLEHKAATIIGTVLVAQYPDPKSWQAYIGGLLVAWALKSSNTLNAAPVTAGPQPGPVTTASTVVKVLAFGLLLFGLASGCKSDATVAASAVNGAVVTSVDAAMTGWASYTKTNINVSAASILAVSNAYQVYYNSELVLSNLSTVYVSNPTTNAARLIGDAVTTIGLSATNLLNIVQQLSK